MSVESGKRHAGKRTFWEVAGDIVGEGILQALMELFPVGFLIAILGTMMFVVALAVISWIFD